MPDEMRETVPAWRGDWKQRVKERVRQRGFESFLAYLKSNAGVPYSVMARELSEGEDIAPVQLETLHAEDVDPQQRQEAILDSLARFVRGALKKGWGIDRYWETNVIGALSSWSVAWGGGPDLDRLKRALFSLPPPTGWMPEAQGDPVLLRALEAARRQG